MVALYIVIVQPNISRVNSSRELWCCWLLSCQFNAPNCHLSLVLAPVVQGDAYTCNAFAYNIMFNLTHANEVFPNVMSRRFLHILYILCICTMFMMNTKSYANELLLQNYFKLLYAIPVGMGVRMGGMGICNPLEIGTKKQKFEENMKPGI